MRLEVIDECARYFVVLTRPFSFAIQKDAVIDLLLKKERGALKAASRGKHHITVELDDENDGGKEATLDAEGAARAYALKRAELRQRSFHDLAGTVPPEDVPAACLRAASAIAHVMHQHFLLLQWHRTPLDSRNGAHFDFLLARLNCLLTPPFRPVFRAWRIRMAAPVRARGGRADTL